MDRKTYFRMIRPKRFESICDLISRRTLLWCNYAMNNRELGEQIRNFNKTNLKHIDITDYVPFLQQEQKKLSRRPHSKDRVNVFLS